MSSQLEEVPTEVAVVDPVHDAEPAPEPTDSTDSPLPTSESMEHSFGNGRDLS